MTAMFPGSGVPAADAKNSIDANTEANCQELWYSTSRCTPRFDPAAANAVLAELLNLVNVSETVYDCSVLDNVQRSVRRLIQQGTPRFGVLLGGGLNAGGSTSYTQSLSPTPLRYYNGMTLTIIPNVTNGGPVVLNTDGLGDVQVLRNDGAPMQFGDWIGGIPYEIAFWNGNWYNLGLLRSQVPVFLNAPLILWVRTDGSDILGDGSANTPLKAFRTIQHAFDVAAARFAPSLYAVSIMLGIPGTYESAWLSGAQTDINLIGDPANPALYKIASKSYGSSWAAIGCSDISIALIGVTFLSDAAGAGTGLNCFGGTLAVMQNCRFEATVDNAGMGMLGLSGGATLFTIGSIVFDGKFHTIGSFIGMTKTAAMGRADPTSPVTITFVNTTISSVAFSVTDLSSLDFESTTSIPSGVTGVKHLVTMNSLLQMRGQAEPGSVAGSANTGGQFAA